MPPPNAFPFLCAVTVEDFYLDARRLGSLIWQLCRATLNCRVLHYPFQLMVDAPRVWWSKAWQLGGTDVLYTPHWPGRRGFNGCLKAVAVAKNVQLEWPERSLDV